MKTFTFYAKIPNSYNIFLKVIGIILGILTLLLTYNTIYDFFFEHKYWLNRRILYKYLRSKPKILNKKYLEPYNITEYTFKDIVIWVYNNKLGLNVSLGEDNDIIGLFTSSRREKRLVIKIIKLLNREY